MKHLILALLTLGLIVLHTPAAFACQCNIRKHRIDFRNAKAVFIGRVVHVSPNLRGDVETRRILPYVVKLAVEKRWKGRKSPQITVLTNNGTGGCGGFVFREGERYLVYAFGEEMEAYSACTRSRPLDQPDEFATENFKQLNSFWFRMKARVYPF